MRAHPLSTLQSPRLGFRTVLPHQEVLDDLDGFLLDLAAETMAGARHYLEGGVLVGLVGFF